MKSDLKYLKTKLLQISAVRCLATSPISDESVRQVLTGILRRLPVKLARNDMSDVGTVAFQEVIGIFFFFLNMKIRKN